MPSIRGSLRNFQPLVEVNVAPIVDAGHVGHPTNESYTALIDTGATKTCVTRAVIERLGLRPVGRVLVASATAIERRRAYGFSLGFYCDVEDDLGGARTLFSFPLDIGGPDFVSNSNFDVLIGMDIISRGRLVFEPGGSFEFRF